MSPHSDPAQWGRGPVEETLMDHPARQIGGVVISDSPAPCDLKSKIPAEEAAYLNSLSKRASAPLFVPVDPSQIGEYRDAIAEHFDKLLNEARPTFERAFPTLQELIAEHIDITTRARWTAEDFEEPFLELFEQSKSARSAAHHVARELQYFTPTENALGRKLWLSRAIAGYTGMVSFFHNMPETERCHHVWALADTLELVVKLGNRAEAEIDNKLFQVAFSYSGIVVSLVLEEKVEYDLLYKLQNVITTLLGDHATVPHSDEAHSNSG